MSAAPRTPEFEKDNREFIEGLIKERTPRLDWAGLLRRAFALDVFSCVTLGQD